MDKSMSSEKRRMAPYALDKEVPPLKTRLANSSPWSAKSRFRVQQTQKSFSMIVFATPRAAPASPNSAARSFGGSRATLSIDVGHHRVGDRDERGPHPCRRLHSGGRERPLVARGELARGCLHDIRRTHWTNVAKGLNDGARRTAGSNQVLRGGMAKVYHSLAQHDATGWTISKVGVLRRHLRCEAKSVCGARTCDLNQRSGLASQGMRNIVRGRRKLAELRVNLGKIVEAARKTAKLAVLDQPGKRLVDRGARGHVQK